MTYYQCDKNHMQQVPQESDLGGSLKQLLEAPRKVRSNQHPLPSSWLQKAPGNIDTWGRRGERRGGVFSVSPSHCLSICLCFWTNTLPASCWNPSSHPRSGDPFRPHRDPGPPIQGPLLNLQPLATAPALTLLRPWTPTHGPLLHQAHGGPELPIPHPLGSGTGAAASVTVPDGLCWVHLAQEGGRMLPSGRGSWEGCLASVSP